SQLPKVQVFVRLPEKCAPHGGVTTGAATSHRIKPTTSASVSAHDVDVPLTAVQPELSHCQLPETTKYSPAVTFGYASAAGSTARNAVLAVITAAIRTTARRSIVSPLGTSYLITTRGAGRVAISPSGCARGRHPRRTHHIHLRDDSAFRAVRAGGRTGA